MFGEMENGGNGGKVEEVESEERAKLSFPM